jgi:uncharacterized protein YbcI
MNDTTPETHTRAGHEGEALAEVSRRLVQLHKECYGRGPTKARSFLSEGVLVCLLDGGFMQMERTLREHGRGDLVTEAREAMQGVLRERFVSEIERIMGRRVTAFLSASDDQSEISAEVFVLETPSLELGSEEKAVHSWGQQTRRQSRSLRDEQRSLRDENTRLRDENVRLREELESED